MTLEKTVAELATIVGGELLSGDRSRRVRRVMPIEQAADDAVTFVSAPKYLRFLGSTRAAAVMTSPAMIAQCQAPEHVAVIGVVNPYVAFARAAQALAKRIPQPSGVHPSAVIDPSATVGAGAAIGPFCYVGAGATIGEGAVLYPGVHVEVGSTVGAGSILYDHVVVRHDCHVGARCILHAGVIVGSDGFGFAQEPNGAASVSHVKIPQTGDVVIEDDVEIGANSCVDRATLGTTRVGRGTKIDNLVQVGHNVQIGEDCILVAQCGVAGSSRLGARVILGAQSGISGHIEVGEGALILGQSGVMQNVPAGQKMGGSPAVTASEFFRNAIRMSKFDGLAARLRELERRVLGNKAT